MTKSYKPATPRGQPDGVTMNEYLITPRYTLGSDCFTVFAYDEAGARAAAKERIKREDWHDPNGWMVYQLLGSPLDDDNEQEAGGDAALP